MRRNNLNTLERIEREKIRVARDDVRRAPAHREFEELVVLRITANCKSYINLNPLSLARQSRQKAPNIFLVYIAKKLFPAQNFIEFGECREGEQDRSVLESQLKCKTRLRIGQEQRIDQNVCIENAAQLCALKKRIQNFWRKPSPFRFATHFIEHLL